MVRSASPVVTFVFHLEVYVSRVDDQVVFGVLAPFEPVERHDGGDEDQRVESEQEVLGRQADAHRAVFWCHRRDTKNPENNTSPGTNYVLFYAIFYAGVRNSFGLRLRTSRILS